MTDLGNRFSPCDLEFIALRRGEVQSNALWIYDFDGFAITWANPPALKLWCADTIEELAARDLQAEMSEGVASRLAQYREDFRHDASRIFAETWTLYPRQMPVLLECRFHWCPLPNGRECTMVEGRALDAQNPETMRSVDALLHSQVMTALYSEDGSELFANRALRDALGPGPLPFGHGFVDKHDHENFVFGLEMHGRHRDTIQIDTRLGERWYDLQAVRCQDAATGHAAFQVSATDVTAMQAYERELEAARDRAQSADRAKSEFVASMSHEMRTPMNGILGMVELLSHTGLDTNQTRQVEIVRDSGKALLALIEDVLDLSSIDLKAVNIERSGFDVHEIAKSVIDGLVPPARLKGLELSLNLAPDLPSLAMGDGRRLGQLMRNLIGNAIKFTKTGGVTLHLSPQGDAGLRVDVIDTGPGVPEAERKKVFERFYQASATRSDTKSGVGLGLAICKQIVALQGGEIGVEAAASGGACFWFTLPETFETDIETGFDDDVVPGSMVHALLSRSSAHQKMSGSGAVRPNPVSR